MSDLSKYLYTYRRRTSDITDRPQLDEFCSDKSRIIFCSSFRRMMQKAQVFSLETNPSVRNRLTHSLEVADVGRTIAREVGYKLRDKKIIEDAEIAVIEAIVENACLIHDIGNPPFGHFGEAAIKNWFNHTGKNLVDKARPGELSLDDQFIDFEYFDGNPQGFRIATKLHNDRDHFGLNLTAASLLTSIKYPNSSRPDKENPLKKKLGIFKSEESIYTEICQKTGQAQGSRYFLAYLMELADDICYCLSDIADSFEKHITTSRDFKAEFAVICGHMNVDSKTILPTGSEKITSFSNQVAIKVSRMVVKDAAEYFVQNISSFLAGEHPGIASSIPSGKYLECLKAYARRHIYTVSEVQSIEIAGSTIVAGLLTHFSRLLKIDAVDFKHFAENDEMKKNSNLDIEWRIFKQLSHRMVKCYKYELTECRTEFEERMLRARLIIDFISGLTDASALNYYQTFMGIRLD